jgi:Cu/Ag efflux protein CusF
MTRRIFAVFPMLLLILAGCTGKAPEKASEKAAEKNPVKRYPMQGEIKALDASAHTATIAAGPIGDWMGPMTMEYPVKPDAEFQKLHVGDRIEATVIVGDPAYYVTEIKIAPK